MRHQIIIKNLFHICTFILLISFFVCNSNQKADKMETTRTFTFENLEDANTPWKQYKWGGEGEFTTADSGHAGNRSAEISSRTGADYSWGILAPVLPFSKYRLSGWIKTDSLVATTGKGALFNLHGISGAETVPLSGTNDWTEVQTDFDTEMNDVIHINCLFGGWGFATGTAWFDDVKLELLETREMKPEAAINFEKTGEPISPYIYGQFIEHLGRCIYGGIWAEMLEDRKFYFAVGDSDSPWTIIGDTDAVRMLRENSYVGEITPEIRMPGDGTKIGIEHGNLGLESGKGYVGRIVLAGDASAVPVQVSLVWGKGKINKQTFFIDELKPQFTKYYFQFTAGKNTDEGRLQIVSQGNGKFQVGAVSLMPADNVNGFRADVVQLLKELNSPVYRWPGGNFVSGYDWKDGIGDPDRRPPRKNPAWMGIEHNDVGIHEFIALCREIDTEPYITVNTGLGSPELAAEQVEYCNGSLNTPMGKWRAENGSEAPFNVTWWAVGNEMYGHWQLGNMPVEEYVKKHNETVKVMRAVDSNIVVVAVGAVGKWDEMMLSNCADHMDHISEHFYNQERPGLLAHIGQPKHDIRRIANAYREYRKNISALAGKDIKIIMDEWNYWYGPHVFGELGTRYFLKDGLGIAAGLHEYFRSSDIIYMANYAQTVNVIGCIKTTKTKAAFETTGLVLKMYRAHFGVIPVEVSGAPEPLDVAAAWTSDKKYVTIGVVNPTEDEIELPVILSGASLSSAGTVWQIAGSDPDAFNDPGKKQKIRIEEKSIHGFLDHLTIPALSASVFKFEVE